MSRLSLSSDEARLLTMARPLQAIRRPCVRDHPFRLDCEALGTPRSEARFSEALVLAMIGRGLLTVTQCAKSLPVWGQPGVIEDRPFSCILSKDGLVQRGYLFGDRPFRAANDTAEQGRAA